MNSGLNKRSCFNPKYLFIDHNVIDYKYNSDINPLNEHKKDENEKKLLDFISDKEKFNIKPYYNRKEFIDFLGSKLKAMEKMNLDDECFIGEIETRKIDIDKNIFPKSRHSKNKKGSISPKSKISLKNSPKKKSENQIDNKNFMIKVNGNIDEFNMKNVNLADNADINKKIKGKEFDEFFSDKTILVSIISEME